MSDLAQWLLAQIADDEAAARKWQAAMEQDEIDARGVPAWVVVAGGVVVPARVLAECEAKRRIVELHAPDHLEPDICSVCASHSDMWPCRTLTALAAPYADRPGFEEAWR